MPLAIEADSAAHYEIALGGLQQYYFRAA